MAGAEGSDGWTTVTNGCARPARALIDECQQVGRTIRLSAVGSWEAALLVERGHVALDERPRPGCNGSSVGPRCHQCCWTGQKPAALTRFT